MVFALGGVTCGVGVLPARSSNELVLHVAKTVTGRRCRIHPITAGVLESGKLLNIHDTSLEELCVLHALCVCSVYSHACADVPARAVTGMTKT